VSRQGLFFSRWGRERPKAPGSHGALALISGAARAKALRQGALIALSSALQVLVLVLVGESIALGPGSRGHVFAAIGGLASVAGFYFAYRHGGPGLVRVTEEAIAQLRGRVSERIAAAGLRDVETIADPEPIFTRDIEKIASSFSRGVPFVQSAAVGLSVLLYIGYSSLFTLLVFCGATLLLWPRLGRELDRSRAAAQRMSVDTAGYQRLLRQAIHGLPLLKLDRRAGDALFAELESYSNDLEEKGLALDTAARSTQVASWNIVLLGTAVVLFVVPMNTDFDVQAIYTMTLLLNLLDAPVLFFVRQLHGLVSAGVAHQNIVDFEAKLPPEPVASGAAGAAPAFREIALSGVSFVYEEGGKGGFSVGPIDLTFGPGEIVLITGENGGGKTTLMKLLAGLYTPQEGHFAIDGRRLEPRDSERHRGLCSAIFSDHHLFARLYDGEEVGRPAVNALLERFGLRGLTRFKGGRFTNLDLSPGQARRLAMVVALLEDRPILLLDEWAAHQDPSILKFYYTELLPELRALGKTVLAVSHDEQFFHVADRRIELEAGRIRVSKG
jgi:putative ATP-binding cassette transporter